MGTQYVLHLCSSFSRYLELEFSLCISCMMYDLWVILCQMSAIISHSQIYQWVEDPSSTRLTTSLFSLSEFERSVKIGRTQTVKRLLFQVNDPSSAAGWSPTLTPRVEDSQSSKQKEGMRCLTKDYVEIGDRSDDKRQEYWQWVRHLNEKGWEQDISMVVRSGTLPEVE